MSFHSLAFELLGWGEDHLPLPRMTACKADDPYRAYFDVDDPYLTPADYKRLVEVVCAYLPGVTPEQWFRASQGWRYECVQDAVAVARTAGPIKPRRPCYDRDHTWLRWHEEEGMGPAAIRDRWNKEHPKERIAKGEGGRDLIEKALRKARAERSLDLIEKAARKGHAGRGSAPPRPKS
jgi:hypothetical protein